MRRVSPYFFHATFVAAIFVLALFATPALAAGPDLASSATADRTEVTPGGTVSYVFEFRNAGDIAIAPAAMGITFASDTSDCAWTCTAGGGASCPSASGSGDVSAAVPFAITDSLRYAATCRVRPTASYSLRARAFVEMPAGVVDQNPYDNSSTADVTVVGWGDLSVWASDARLSIDPGTSLTYQIEAKNEGVIAAVNAHFVNDFAPGLVCGWSCTPLIGAPAECPVAQGHGDIDLLLTLPAPTPSGTSGLRFTATCTTSPTAVGVITNTATITGATGFVDARTYNNIVTDTTHTDAVANIGLEPPYTPFPNPGSSLLIGARRISLLPFRVYNASGVDVDVRIRFDVPPQVEVTSLYCVQSSCRIVREGNLVTIELSLHANSSTRIQLDGNVLDGPADSLDFHVTAEVIGGADSAPADNVYELSWPLSLFRNGFQ
jgi:uncharacterized repeat protein (TIGR01451 family)